MAASSFTLSQVRDLTKYVDINVYAAMSKRAAIPFSTAVMVRDTCLCLHVQRAARALARRFDEALRPLGLTSGQFSLLMALNRPAPPAISAVAGVLAVDRTTLTAALKPLERRGLVATERDPRDKRSRLLRLTPAGFGILAEAVPIWNRTHAAVESRVGGAGPDALRASLVALSQIGAPADPA
jgi:DNA-binding MarR family transcriptional regulator